MNRDQSVDFFKGLLVMGMVYAHVLQFFSHRELFPSTIYLTDFFNLITFSGFVFCFGYVCYLAYYQKPFGQVFSKMLKTSLKILIAFYISGIAFLIFIESEPMNFHTFKSVILLQNIPGWSEFLVSFALIILIGLLFFKWMLWLIERRVIFWIVTISLLFVSFINFGRVQSTYVALFIGTTDFPTFPVLQYFPFYLIGIYFAKYRVEFTWKGFLFSFIGMFIFLTYLFLNQFGLPERFPPSFYWIVGPTFVLYLYYALSKVLETWKKGLSFIRVMGENVLFFLLVSNLLIFSLSATLKYFVFGPWKGLLFTSGILSVILFLIDIIGKRSVKVKG